MLTVMTGCMVITALSFLSVYACITAFTDETWPDF